jgi:hypothetical protein
MIKCITYGEESFSSNSHQTSWVDMFLSYPVVRECYNYADITYLCLNWVCDAAQQWNLPVIYTFSLGNKALKYSMCSAQEKKENQEIKWSQAAFSSHLFRQHFSAQNWNQPVLCYMWVRGLRKCDRTTLLVCATACLMTMPICVRTVACIAAVAPVPAPPVP